ncbi:glycine oxidase ThiO [Glycomyces sp. TRM65418]|uniref:glycine oxidase ThiO n=1 Tax=Glycomyces sp. TRM65418 TaxID=2867006 RepID=UPI001CE6F6D5|nr:glycine oxidase ThiO [Glycomyces sp. TRM65418]MCC3765020.1 glycine oxidase ThiO [Glycomyces sp. TRM65418]QZD54649.1 glycine oxidase ThiO [Glycomyces sp. TRM65418]
MRIAVVGAGSIGLAVAWRAAQDGAEVVVHDPDPGSGASRVAAGMIAAVTEAHFGEEALGPFMAESADAWPAFARDLEAASGVDLGFRDVPTLVVGVEDGDRAEIERLAGLYRFTARNVETLTARAARKAEPLLSHRVRGGVLAPEDRAVDPRAVHRALLVAAERAGVELRRERVEDSAALDADQVVIAAGCGSTRCTGGSAQWSLPVRPVRGAVLRLRAVGDQPKPRTTVRGWVKGHSVYIVTRASGEVVVGATSDERGFDRLTGTAGAVHDLLRWSIELVPEIAEYHLDEVSVGFRPGTPDNLPLIGRLDERTVAATGHYRNGIALIPSTASTVAALLRGAGEGPPKAFDPLRFSEPQGRSAGRFEDTAERPGTRFASAPDPSVPEGSGRSGDRRSGAARAAGHGRAEGDAGSPQPPEAPRSGALESTAPTGSDHPDPRRANGPSDPGDKGPNGNSEEADS